MKAPETIQTERLLLRRPQMEDAQEIFERYASDPDVTRYLHWETHGSVDATREFLRLSHAAWEAGPAGPYLIRSRESGLVLGSTGLDFEIPDRPMTGYVLAQDAWGQGFATEALGAMVDLARSLDLPSLLACCHPDNAASIRVLEKGGFEFEGRLTACAAFPNLSGDAMCDILAYACDLC